MLTFNSLPHLPTAIHPIPKLTKTATLLPMNIKVTSSVLVVWPYFHNGVAEALRLHHGGVESSWIVFNHRADVGHAGFVFGLGLTGHLKVLETSESLRVFLRNEPLLSMAHLLGLSVCWRGSSRGDIEKMITVHLSSEGHDWRLKTGGVLGFGILHMGRGDGRIWKVIERGHEPFDLGCGFARGFIGLAGCFRGHTVLNFLIGKVGVGGRGSLGTVVAIGLVGLRSLDKDAIACLAVPSVVGISWMSPEILMVRSISYGLVVWDKIKPTIDWIHSLIPSYLHLPDHRHSYISVVTGLCLVMAMKFASTWGVASETVKYFMKSWVGKKGLGYEAVLDRAVTRMCLDNLMVATAIIMAGSCDVSVLGWLEEVKVDGYGSSMALHMSMGLLYLGGGKCTLGTDDVSVAGMVAAFFPIYPCHPDDEFHLQALRHLWVLAVRKGAVVTREVDTGKNVSIPLHIRKKDTVECVSPCVVAGFEKVLDISVCGPRYQSLVEKRGGDGEMTIWVSRKPGFQTYADV